MSENPDMPCGRCDVGVYDYACAFNAKAAAIAAGGPLPACKKFTRTCVGAIHLLEFRRSAATSTEDKT